MFSFCFEDERLSTLKTGKTFQLQAVNKKVWSGERKIDLRTREGDWKIKTGCEDVEYLSD